MAGRAKGGVDRQTVDKRWTGRWLAECNYIHRDDPSEELGQVPMAADSAAHMNKPEAWLGMEFGLATWDQSPKTHKPLLPRRPSGPPPDVITHRQVHGAGQGHRVQKEPLLVFL